MSMKHLLKLSIVYAVANFANSSATVYVQNSYVAGIYRLYHPCVSSPCRSHVCMYNVVTQANCTRNLCFAPPLYILYNVLWLNDSHITRRYNTVIIHSRIFQLFGVFINQISLSRGRILSIARRPLIFFEWKSTNQYTPRGQFIRESRKKKRGSKIFHPLASILQSVARNHRVANQQSLITRWYTHIHIHVYARSRRRKGRLRGGERATAKVPGM